MYFKETLTTKKNSVSGRYKKIDSGNTYRGSILEQNVKSFFNRDVDKTTCIIDSGDL